MPERVDPARLASDGADVLEGVEAPTEDELAAMAELTEDEQRQLIADHLKELDRGDR